MLHAENKPLDEIILVIAKAGFQTETTVRGRLSFLNHGLRAPFVYAYWCGETAVHDVWKTVAPSSGTISMPTCTRRRRCERSGQANRRPIRVRVIGHAEPPNH